MSEVRVIANLTKNRRETLRVALDSYRGTNLIDLRVTVPLAEHSTAALPTKKGVSVNVELIPELRAALADAEAVARELGWLQ